MNKNAKKFVLVQIILVMAVILFVSSYTSLVRAQTEVTHDPGYLSVIVIAIALSVSIPALSAGLVLKTVGTAVVSALTERESTFGKALVIVVFGETLAIYGLVIALILLSRLPALAA
jgi:F0F1-type ATP synthase membrane subunit c/vacuolar-type H+-ATPase subunit K